MLRISTSLTKRQYLPTLEDINNDELKTLAKRLKGYSEKETLTNVLEWQDRNIQFWWERWLIPLLVLFPILLVFFSLLVIVVGSLLHLAESLSCFFLPIFGGLGASIFALGYLLIRYRIFFEKKNVKVLIDTFRPSLPVDKILERNKKKYRWATCRDYAKLTASLLFNIYPDSELYFITIPHHVAVGIKAENKYYVFDQYLPILSLDKWLIEWGKKSKYLYL